MSAPVDALGIDPATMEEEKLGAYITSMIPAMFALAEESPN